MRDLARDALRIPASEWSVAKQLARLPAGKAPALRSCIEAYQDRMVSLKHREPSLGGALAKSVADAFAPLGAKMRPDMSEEQAGFWASSIVMAFSDLPPFIVQSAMAEAMHVPWKFPTDMEAGVRTIALRKLEEHKTAILRLHAMLDEIHRAASPAQPQLEAPAEDVEWSDEELHRLTPALRKMGISAGWLTQEMLDKADAIFGPSEPAPAPPSPPPFFDDEPSPEQKEALRAKLRERYGTDNAE